MGEVKDFVVGDRREGRRRFFAALRMTGWERRGGRVAGGALRSRPVNLLLKGWLLWLLPVGWPS
jgi:hypothetical protein